MKDRIRDKLFNKILLNTFKKAKSAGPLMAYAMYFGDVAEYHLAVDVGDTIQEKKGE